MAFSFISGRNPELILYGTNITATELDTFSELTTATSKQALQPIVPQVLPPVLPIVQPAHVQVPIVVEPPPKRNRASGKKRVRAEVPEVPSPQDNVALPRDTLLQITSQSMDKYVETLQTTRQLSTDDQKELKRQKRYSYAPFALLHVIKRQRLMPWIG